MTKELIIKALQRALNSEKPTERVIHHSDRGANMLRITINHSYKNIHFQVSMPICGNCYDNACIELLHSLIKKECIYPNRFLMRKEEKQMIFEYI
jgi:putative transposase